jgi:hypothetical protein
VWHGGSSRRFGEKPHTDHSAAGVSYRRYADDRGRFISEFGMHAAPVYETLRRNIPADQLYHHSVSMDHHNKDNPKNKGDRLMESVTGLPDNLGDYIDFSMIAQAEGLKFGVEHFRRRKPHCSGTLFWQLNDCWPVLSYGADYYGTVGTSRRLTAEPGVVQRSRRRRNDHDTTADHDAVIIRLSTFDGRGDPGMERAVGRNESRDVAGGRRSGRRADRRLPCTSGACPGEPAFRGIKDLQRTPQPPDDDHGAGNRIRSRCRSGRRCTHISSTSAWRTRRRATAITTSTWKQAKRGRSLSRILTSR